MTTRRLLALSMLALLAFTTTGCKRARFKSRSVSAPSPSARFTRGLGHADFGGELPSSFARTDDEAHAALFEALREESRRQRETDALGGELTRAFESAVERHCVTVSSDALFLEPQGQALQSLFRSMRTLSAPADVRLPRAAMVMGLPVHVMHRGAEARWCADQDEALVGRVVQRGDVPAKAQVTALTRGAWLVRTQPGLTTPASASLVSRPFLESLGVKGSLVAFAPTDHAIAYADASNPAAVTAAAKAIVSHLDATGEDGVLQSQPLERRAGTWRAWTPKTPSAEVKAAIAMALELETSTAAEMVNDLLKVNLALALAPELRKTAAQVADAEATTRSRTAEGKVSVRVEADLFEPQLVGVAQVVEVVDLAGHAANVSWAAFEAKAKPHLSPVTVDGVAVPRLYRLGPDFTWPSRVD
jgi:hypothetical protein